MERNTFTEYAWIIVTVVVVSVLLTFAVGFGEFIETETSNQVDSIINMMVEEDVETSGEVVIEDNMVITNE